MPRKFKQRETNAEFLVSRGWRNVAAIGMALWTHDNSALRRVDGLFQFTSEAVEIQRRRDRSEAE